MKQLQRIEQKLKDDSAYVENYHQGVNKDEKLLIYSSMFESVSAVKRVLLKDLVTGKIEYLSPDVYGFEDAIFFLNSEFLQTLSSSYYYIELILIEESGVEVTPFQAYFRVYSSEESFEEGSYIVAGNYLEYRYMEHRKLHTNLRLDNHVKISAICTQFGEQVPTEQYRILFDGKAIEFSEELLEPCKNQKKIMILIEFDDGRQEFITIENPYIN